MPLLPKETEVFPEDLFDLPVNRKPWLVVHVRSRQEKLLARHLVRSGIPFYLPQIEKKTKRGGRTFRSYAPLFPGYVFLRGGPEARDSAWRSDVAANVIDVEDQDVLHQELWQLRQLQLTGASLTPQLELVAGVPVRVTEGMFAGYTGIVVKERDHERLIVTISHLHRAVAVELSRDSVVRAPVR
jgi:transcription antitermination factor NusG